MNFYPMSFYPMNFYPRLPVSSLFFVFLIFSSGTAFAQNLPPALPALTKTICEDIKAKGEPLVQAIKATLQDAFSNTNDPEVIASIIQYIIQTCKRDELVTLTAAKQAGVLLEVVSLLGISNEILIAAGYTLPEPVSELSTPFETDELGPATPFVP